MKLTSEKEVMRKEVADVTERLTLLEKASRQLELDNERLAYKVNYLFILFILIFLLSFSPK